MTSNMAATTAFPSLSLPAQEDSMEMASPANQNLDDDIDIDFDDGNYDGGVQLLDDEQMITDGEPTRPATATDDMMDDDVLNPDTHVQETEMHDTPDVEQQQSVQLEDEELIDYGEEDYFDQQQAEDSAVQDVVDVDYAQQVPPHVEEVLEVVDEEVVRQPEDAVLEQANATGEAREEAVDVHAEALGQDETGQPLDFGDEDAFNFTEDLEQTLVAEATEAQDEYAVAEGGAQEAAGDAEALQAPLTIDTSLDAQADAPGTPTDTGLHPMTVSYDGHVMPLFKSKKQLDGLLKDDNLANLSLAELMRNCKQRLALKIGNVPEDQELTLAFDHMGLMLTEVRGTLPTAYWQPLTLHQNSRAAYQHSLNDVLEVYLSLHQNDGTYDIPALSLSLSQPQFSDHLAVLQQAAASGKGISAFVQPDESGEQYYGDGDEEAADVENANAQDEGQEQEEYHNSGEDHEGQEYTQDQDYVEQEYEDEAVEGMHKATDVGEYSHQSQERAAETAVSDDAGHQALEPVALIAATDSAVHEGDHSAAHDKDAVPAKESHDGAKKAESTASSRTIQGDKPNEGVGEYDEDFIDYDEDSDLTSPTSELPVDGQDDFSTFLTEYGADENGNGYHAQQAEDSEHVAFDDEHTLSEEAANASHQSQHAGAEDQQHQILRSEDFLNELDNELNGTDAYDEQHHASEDDERAQNEEQYDQADSNDEQQFQPGEDDEQYDTTYDFQNGESDGHGLEHEPEGYQDQHNPAETYQEDPEDQFHDKSLNGDNHVQLAETVTEPEDELIEYPDDFIDYDDDTTEQHEARKASEAVPAAVSTGSPLGKRSFEEHAETDELDFGDDEPEAKKVRAE